MTDKKQLIKEKIELLNKAAKAYYQDAAEIMSNYEYDRLYDELVQLEAETGIVMANSPTQNVGYEVLSELPKEAHPSRMLSLDKTKDRESLAQWLGNQKGLLSWKLDGLTIVLTYEGGTLIKALTRGNGEIGEVITNNAKVFANIPLSVPYKGRMVLRGEAVITYSEFEKINEEISDIDAKYKNPRNLCSGSVRQLNNQITAKRNVHFYAFSLVEAEGVDFGESRENQMLWLKKQGFDVVEYRAVDSSSVVEAVEWFEQKIEDNDVPSDGLVLTMDNIAYARSLGTTAKFPRDSIAFKWQDQAAETVLREIEWSASRTGLINPVAIFDPVELEGTTVSRASVHNLSVMKELALGIGDIITVYKANMIIPQIAENLTRSGNISIPCSCPVCGMDTEIKKDADSEVLICSNPQCLAKQIKGFTLFVSRDAMNIEGLSEATIEKFIAKGFIKEPADIFKLDKFKEQITSMDGFGEKSYVNLTDSIEKARKTTAQRLLYSLGITGFGVANAKVISRYAGEDFAKIRNLTFDELVEIDGIGDVLAMAYTQFFADENKQKIIDDLLDEVKLEAPKQMGEQFLAGVTFVITGSLNHYENRNALKEAIENAGGKVAGSVSAKTAYLINNDVTSASGKNKKAKELGVPIIDEETIMSWLEQGVIENA